MVLMSIRLLLRSLSAVVAARIQGNTEDVDELGRCLAPLEDTDYFR